ncbi:MAG: preprotein translocase subunit YajC, partial [Victivallaceae bacterium]
TATATTPAANAQNPFVGMLPIIVIFGVMIFFMIRSQKKQAQKRQTMLDSIKKGDRVVTAGGICGTVDEVKEKTYMVEIADKVKVEVAKSGVSGIFGENDTTACCAKN